MVRRRTGRRGKEKEEEEMGGVGGGEGRRRSCYAVLGVWAGRWPHSSTPEARRLIRSGSWQPEALNTGTLGTQEGREKAWRKSDLSIAVL